MVAGGCRCDALRYTLALDALPRTYACHCRDCQTWTGTAFSQQAVITEAQISVEGETALFELPHPSGERVSRQHVCGRCHMRLYNINTGRPGFVALRAGTLDHSDELMVVAHIWTKRKQPWFIVPDSEPSWPEAAPPAPLAAALFPPS